MRAVQHADGWSLVDTMTKHKTHKTKRPKSSLHTHGRKNHRAAKGRHGGGDSGFGSALAGLTSIGHARGY